MCRLQSDFTTIWFSVSRSQDWRRKGLPANGEEPRRGRGWARDGVLLHEIIRMVGVFFKPLRFFLHAFLNFQNGGWFSLVLQGRKGSLHSPNFKTSTESCSLSPFILSSLQQKALSISMTPERKFIENNFKKFGSCNTPFRHHGIVWVWRADMLIMWRRQ